MKIQKFFSLNGNFKGVLTRQSSVIKTFYAFLLIRLLPRILIYRLDIRTCLLSEIGVNDMSCLPDVKFYYVRDGMVMNKKKEKKKHNYSHAGNRTRAAAVRAPNPNH